jgi:hypothetical protein
MYVYVRCAHAVYQFHRVAPKESGLLRTPLKIAVYVVQVLVGSVENQARKIAAAHLEFACNS